MEPHAVAVPTLNWIIVNYSWHWAFGALGVAGLAWAVLWVIFGREGTLVDQPANAAEGTVERVPYRHLLTCPAIVATCCAGFASYWRLALGLTWFTSYLVDGLGYSQTAGHRQLHLRRDADDRERADAATAARRRRLNGGWLQDDPEEPDRRLTRFRTAGTSRTVRSGD